MAAALVPMIAAGVVVGGACHSELVHVFGAFPYHVTGDCFDGAQQLDVIDGADPGSCPTVRCWVNHAGDAFVTDRACDAPIDLTESDSGACKLALEAFKTRVTCPVPADGGDADAGGS